MSSSSNNKNHETDLLDRVLEGKSDEVKARVLEMVYRLGISPKDELFLIMIALNHLQLIIESTPEYWEDLFTDFQAGLELWAESNHELLTTHIAKADSERLLANTSQQLVSALANLIASCNQITRELQTSARNSPNSSAVANSFYKDLIATLHQDMIRLKEQNGQLSRLLTDLHHKGSGNRQGNGLWLALGTVAAMLLLSNWYMWATINDTNQRVHWILERQIKAECLVKTKPDKNCKGIYNDRI